MKTWEFAEFTVRKIVPCYGTSIGALRARGGGIGRGEAVGNLSRRKNGSVKLKEISTHTDCSLEVRTWWWMVGNELVYFGMKTGVERSGLERV